MPRFAANQPGGSQPLKEPLVIAAVVAQDLPQLDLPLKRLLLNGRWPKQYRER